MIELDPLYVDVAIRRWERITGIPARHGELGLTFAEDRRKARESTTRIPVNLTRQGSERRPRVMAKEYRSGTANRPRRPGSGPDNRAIQGGVRRAAKSGNDLSAELGEQITVREGARRDGSASSAP